MNPAGRGAGRALSRLRRGRHVACAFDMAASGIRLWHSCPTGLIRKPMVTAALPPVFRPSRSEGGLWPLRLPDVKPPCLLAPGLCRGLFLCNSSLRGQPARPHVSLCRLAKGSSFQHNVAPLLLISGRGRVRSGNAQRANITSRASSGQTAGIGSTDQAPSQPASAHGRADTPAPFLDARDSPGDSYGVSALGHGGPRHRGRG